MMAWDGSMGASRIAGLVPDRSEMASLLTACTVHCHILIICLSVCLQ